MDPRRAVFLSFHREDPELEELADSLGLHRVETVRQNRAEEDARTYLGSGTIDALAARLEQDPDLASVDLCLVADDVKAATILRLQTLMGVEVWDRTRLILEIFTVRASSQEARLQVELARLRYEMPLVREAIHMEKSGERPGFMGSGEMAFVDYHTHIRRRMARIREELDHVRGERDVRRAHRRRGGFWLVALAGYTNAGKSTLLNALTEGGAESEDRLFSTLSTRTRRITLGGGSRLLLTDTVGFIQDLPPWLVEAFHATLEEVTLADVILLVADASDRPEELRRKLETSLAALRRLRRETDAGERGKVLLVMNKVDRSAVPEAALHQMADELGLGGDCVAVSARTGEGLPALLEAARAHIADRAEIHLDVPADGEGRRFLAWASDQGEANVVQANGRFDITLGIREAQRGELRRRLKQAGGVIVGAA